MSIREWVKNKVRNWLNIAPAQPQLMTIYEPYSHETNVTINEIWYCGKAYELQQLYHSLRLDISQAGFWSQVGYSDNIRKIHSGLPPDLNSPLKIPMKSRSFLDLLYMGVV